MRTKTYGVHAAAAAAQHVDDDHLLHGTRIAAVVSSAGERSEPRTLTPPPPRSVRAVGSTRIAMMSTGWRNHSPGGSSNTESAGACGGAAYGWAAWSTKKLASSVAIATPSPGL